MIFIGAPQPPLEFPCVAPNFAVLFETRRDDCRRRNWCDRKGPTLFAFARPPPCLICRVRQAHAAVPIELFERGEGRHAGDLAVGEFGHEGRTEPLAPGGFRFGNAIAGRLDDGERFVERAGQTHITPLPTPPLTFFHPTTPTTPP